MKVLSFSGSDEIYLKHILPALLNTFIIKDKTKPMKGSTMRPAWKIESVVNKKIWGADIEFAPKYMKEKQPRFKVGDIFRAEWKSRTSPKGSWFCKRHGIQIIKQENFKISPLKTELFCFGDECNCTPKVCYTFMDRELFDEMFFPKILGYGRITKVFKIEMVKECDKPFKMFRIYNINGEKIPNKIMIGYEMEEIAKRDGFPDAKTMFNWFDRYDLKIPKPFYVYGYEPISEKEALK